MNVSQTSCDQAEIKRRADDAEREHWRAEARRLRGSLDQMKADAAALLPDCCCLSPKDALALAFRTGEDPAPCPVHDIEQTIDAGIALNDARALSERSGFPLATTE